jgi:type IV pilus assembly protein PilW
MVAITISLIILAALTSVMVNTKRANTEQNAFGRLQENGRIATQIMTRELQQSGYFGCGTLHTANFKSNLVANSTYTNMYSTDIRVEGSEKGTGLMYPGSASVPIGAASDVVGVRYLDVDNEITVIPPFMTQETSDLYVATGNDLKPGDIVMVTNCTGGDVFQITSGDPNGSGIISHTVGTGTPGNASADLGRIYEQTKDGFAPKILQFASSYYFVKNNASGQPSLFRMKNGAEEELVEGIEDLQVTYGIDTTLPDPDFIPDSYVKAGSGQLQTDEDWRRVRTIRFGVLARSLANNTTTASKTTGPVSTAELDSNLYDIDGDGTTDLDASTLSTEDRRYVRKVFRTTISVRNRRL